jgi:hypothetical protein
MFLGIFLSIFGYMTLIRRRKSEGNKERKYFLGLIILFSAVSFIVMLPIIDGPLRYFNHVFFVPFIFLGLFLEYLLNKKRRSSLFFAIMAVVILVISNLYSLWPVAKDLLSKDRNGPYSLVQGELEPMVGYMDAQNNGNSQNIYLVIDSKYSNFYKSLSYLAGQKNIKITKAKIDEALPSGSQVYYLSSRLEDTGTMPDVSNWKIESWQNFGHVAIFKLSE